jgi:transposase
MLAERQISCLQAFLYRYRNLVERFFNKLKQDRGIAPKYESSEELLSHY